MNDKNNQRGLCSEEGAAAIEMAILMPLYMIVLFGLLFLGYLTLGMARQQQAAAFAGWLSGTQSSEELLERFYPWVEDTGRGTFEVGAGREHEMSLEVLSDRSMDVSGYPRETVEDIMTRKALGDPRQVHTWQGGVTSEIRFDQTEFGRYLTARGLSQPTGYPLSPPPANLLRTVNTLNGPGDQPWLTRREAEIRMRFRPSYLRWAFREDATEDLTLDTYLIGQPPQHRGAPEFDARVALVGRGPLQRRAAGEDGASAGTVYAETMDLLGGSLPAPMDPVRLEQVVTAMGIMDGHSLYRPRPLRQTVLEP